VIAISGAFTISQSVSHPNESHPLPSMADVKVEECVVDVGDLVDGRVAWFPKSGQEGRRVRGEERDFSLARPKWTTSMQSVDCTVTYTSCKMCRNRKYNHLEWDMWEGLRGRISACPSLFIVSLTCGWVMIDEVAAGRHMIAKSTIRDRHLEWEKEAGRRVRRTFVDVSRRRQRASLLFSDVLEGRRRAALVSISPSERSATKENGREHAETRVRGLRPLPTISDAEHVPGYAVQSVQKINCADLVSARISLVTSSQKVTEVTGSHSYNYHFFRLFECAWSGYGFADAVRRT
jgi:hypothetical protein